MRLYLSRWQDGRVSLVSGNDLHSVYQSLDTVGDPSSNFIHQYIGPLCITFKPTIAAEIPQSVDVTLPHRKGMHEVASQCLMNLFESKILSDVELESSDGMKIPCHKAILAQSSQYFHAMFTSGMQESVKCAIKIENVRREILEGVVAFIYRGSLDHWLDKCCMERGDTSSNTKENIELLKELLDAADFFAIDALKECCQWSLLDTLTDCDDVGQFLEDLTEFAVDNNSVLLQAGLLVHVEDVLWGYYKGKQSRAFNFPTQILDQVQRHFARHHLQAPYLVGKDGDLQKLLRNSTIPTPQEVAHLVRQGASIDNVCGLHELCSLWTPFPSSEEQIDNNRKVTELFEWMVTHACVIHKRNSAGFTPLYLAVQSLAQPLTSMIVDKYRQENRNLPDIATLMDVAQQKWDEFLAREWLSEGPTPSDEDAVSLTTNVMIKYLSDINGRENVNPYTSFRSIYENMLSFLRGVVPFGTSGDATVVTEGGAERETEVNPDFINAVFNSDPGKFNVDFVLTTNQGEDGLAFHRKLEETAYPMFSRVLLQHSLQEDGESNKETSLKPRLKLALLRDLKGVHSMCIPQLYKLLSVATISYSYHKYGLV